jgi:ribonuclease P protein component
VAKQLTLGKKERLKSRKLIEQLFSEGKNFVLSPFRIYYIFTSAPTTDYRLLIQLGAGVSGKNFKKAVDRNRIKRLIREAYRLQKTDPVTTGLQGKLKEKNLQLNVFFIYTGKELPGFNMVKEKVKLILNKLLQIADENISSNS